MLDNGRNGAVLATEQSDSPRPEHTGRSLVLLRDGERSISANIQSLRDVAGLRAFTADDMRTDFQTAEVPESGAMLLDHLGVAIVNGDPDQIGRLSIQSTRSDSILAVEPERVVYMASSGYDASFLPMPERSLARAAAAEQPAAMNRDYLRGYRDGFDHAVALCFEAGGGPPPAAQRAALRAVNESAATWGLQATRVLESPWTGHGVKIAVLDTGFTLDHPDFGDRLIEPQSFVAGETPQDGHGHGTHCIGTAAGPRTPGQLPRYGIACDAQIYVGKVLNNQGRGRDGDILLGINWAIERGCRVVSMSLGGATLPGDKPSTVFENMARRALASGTLIVAAAGNESRRGDQPPRIRPVGHPANCPSIMAVAAVDVALQTAWFSNAGLEPNGGQIDITGPGVDVYSAWRMPLRYNTISGTSMATPHVAGLAALHIQANPGITAVDLWTKLVRTARSLGLPAADSGSGLAQAPV